MSIDAMLQKIPLAAVALLGMAGCEATISPPPPPRFAVTYAADAVVPAPSVPYDIYAYPHVYYDDTWVYLYDGRWYYPSPQGWMTYQQEPRELGRSRTRIESSPRDYRYQTPGYTPSPRYSAPPPPPPGPVYQAPTEQGRERRPK